jgi:general L-amino acid transport system substrate-binding protein
VFAGYHPYAGCADSGDFFSPPCLDMKICLVGGTTWFDTAQEVFPSEFISTYAAFEDTVKALQNGECNVIGGSQVDVDLSSIQLYGFEGADDDYEVGQQLYFKSFEAWLTRSDDRVWSRLTSWIFEALVQAEESNITKATYDQMVTTDAFGDGFTDMFRKAVRVVGNYGELWKKNMPFTKRAGMNLINDGSTGAMLSYDFGRVTDQGPEPSLNGLIQAILERGYLRCGVTGGALGFAEFDDVSSTWTGFDIDICRGIAAALFNGDSSKLDISLLSTNDRSAMINRGTVDLIPGLTRTLEREVNDGVNGDAFDFSPPVFHDGMIFAGLTPYGICAEAQIFDASNELGLDCRNTTICVTTGSTWYQALIGPLGVPEENLFLTTTFVDSLAKHIAGECNVIVGETAKLSMMSLQDAGYPLPDDISEYHMGTTKYTKEPICLMHRSDDPQFSDLIKWIVFGFFYAEENGITSASAFEMPRTKLFGIRLSGIWQDSIEAAGNYAEIYDRNIGAIVPRSGRNLLNELSSPQLFASPGTV